MPAGERPGEVGVARGYRRRGEPSGAALLDRLHERLADYHAHVLRVDAAVGIPGAVAGICAAHGLGVLAVPPSLPAAWRPPGVRIVEDEGLGTAELDRVDAALTGCAAAIAQTGTIVLDGAGRSGRRALTLVPDHHLCVIEAGQVVDLVPEAVARLEPAVRERRLPITLVSGPSATSDIELQRVEGVHGPRNLHVMIVSG